MFSTMSDWSGSNPLASSWISCCFPVSWWSCSSFGSSRLHPSCAPAVCWWGRCWDRQTQSPGSGPWQKLSWSGHQLSFALVRGGPALPFHATRANSTVLPKWGVVPTLLSVIAGYREAFFFIFSITEISGRYRLYFNWVFFQYLRYEQRMKRGVYIKNKMSSRVGREHLFC